MDLLANLANIEVNILLYVLYAFSIPHHLKTFFAPFKRMTYNDDSVGLTLEKISSTLSFNLVSIGVGVVVRTIVIAFGLVCLLVIAAALFIFFLFVTLTFPITGPIRLLLKESSDKQLEKWKTKATTNPGQTLKDMLTKTPLGKFTIKQLVMKEEEIKSFATTDAFVPTTEIKTFADLFIILAKDFVPFKKYLEAQLMDEQDIRRICEWYDNLYENAQTNLSDREEIVKISGIGADWSYGYTNEINKFQVKQNYTQFPRVVGRDKEIHLLENQLSKSIQNSCLIYGQPGVGRHPVVDEFSRRLYTGRVNPSLTGFRTIYLDLKSAISGQSDMITARKKALDLFEEARQAGNVILVIDDIEKFFESVNEKIDLADIFVQTLSDGKLRIIGLTNEAAYNHSFAINENLLKLFSPIKISAPDTETVYMEMELSIVPVLEKKHKIIVTYASIKEAITNSDRFISNIPFPEKAINILDEAITSVKTVHPHMQQLWAGDVSRYLSEKTHIPMGSITQDNKNKLNDLENKMHQRIVGQNEAVTSLCKALRRSVLSVSARNKPIGTFLFLGPTGVGKTETAKALAESYFGNESRMLRFDMSEFQGEEGLKRVIDRLSAAISENPFAVILLDEIEKSPPVILNLFLTLLDEGYITDLTGRKISAKQNIIIGTSNAGALFIRDQVEKSVGGEALKTGLIDYVLSQKIFSPEFLNRFDAVIVFEPLTREQISQVARNMLGALNKRLEEKKIKLNITDQLVERLAASGYDPIFGARAMRRYVQDQVEDEIAKKLLAGGGAPGTTIDL